MRLYFENGIQLESKSFHRGGRQPWRTRQGKTPEASQFRLCRHFGNRFPPKISFSFLLIPLPCVKIKKTKRKSTACLAPTSSRTVTNEGPEHCLSLPGAGEKALPPTGSSVGFLLLLHVQEDDAEHEEANHHGEGTGIVRVRRRDETFVLCVLERTDRHLGGKRAAL